MQLLNQNKRAISHNFFIFSSIVNNSFSASDTQKKSFLFFFYFNNAVVELLFSRYLSDLKTAPRIKSRVTAIQKLLLNFKLWLFFLISNPVETFILFLPASKFNRIA